MVMPFVLIIGALVGFAVANQFYDVFPASLLTVLNFLLSLMGFVGTLGLFTMMPWGLFLLLKGTPNVEDKKVEEKTEGEVDGGV